MRRPDLRWLAPLVANMVLLQLGALANHHLAPFGLTLFCGGLLVTYAAARLDLRHGLTGTLLTGLLFDALSPVPFGLGTFFLGLAHVLIFQGRQRFPRDEPVFFTVVALLANLFLFLCLSFALVGDNPRPAAAWGRLFVDLIFSQLALALVAAWFFALQNALIEFTGRHPETGRPLPH
jgi:rod shape-determining protein MreD